MLTIISGGQCGADQAGLEAARQLGVPTGGWAPKNFKTQDNTNITLLRDIYGLKDSKRSYKVRTNYNVRDSDGTIRLCVDFFSPGEICTLNAIKKFNKPSFDVYLINPPSPKRCVEWILTNNIKILNIAGNTQGKRDFDIYSLAGNYLYEVFKLYLEKQNETNIKRSDSK